MSKSLGNVVSPLDIIAKWGGDILRLWVATTDYRDEMHISNKILRNTSEIYRKIRNTSRFLLANLNLFQVHKDMLNFNNLMSIDQWIIIQAQKTAG